MLFEVSLIDFIDVGLYTERLESPNFISFGLPKRRAAVVLS